MSVNAVQAASIYATIANGGVRVAPSLVKGYLDANGKVTSRAPGAATRVVSKKTARQVTRMIEAVVSEEGTAPMASIPGYRVAGKTGTSERYDPRCHGYCGYTASFIGFAPADKPAVVVACALQNPVSPHTGGLGCGPVFTEVMSFGLKTLKVPPTGGTSPQVRLTW
jgi:cell division protein FtsI (penicillin-binding protein 3)